MKLNEINIRDPFILPYEGKYYMYGTRVKITEAYPTRWGEQHGFDVYISEDYMDVLADGEWQKFFTEKPEPLSREEKQEWIAKNTKVSLGSDAFFPFGDNVERAHKSGVEYIAQAGGSVRDDHVIMTCDKYGIAMAFTGVRLFHH